MQKNFAIKKNIKKRKPLGIFFNISRQSGRFPDSMEYFADSLEDFQTVWKILKTVWKIPRQSGRFPDSLEDF